MRSWVERYADDQELFFTNYARAHVKLSEQTHENTLISEFDESNIVNGGYQEKSRLGALLGNIKTLVNGEEGSDNLL